MEFLFVESVIIVMVYLFFSLQVIGAVFLLILDEFVSTVDSLECSFDFSEDSHSLS